MELSKHEWSAFQAEMITALNNSFEVAQKRSDERFAQIDARFAQIDARFAEFDAKFTEFKDEIRADLGEIKNRLDKIESRLDSLEARVDVLGKEVDILRRDSSLQFYEIRTTLVRIDGKLFEHEDRIIKLERH